MLHFQSQQLDEINQQYTPPKKLALRCGRFIKSPAYMQISVLRVLANQQRLTIIKMKFFVAFLAVTVAVVQAKPSGVPAPVIPVALATPISTQFVAQDSRGQYTYGYSNPQSAKTESRSLDGIIRGAYDYVDGSGKLQSVEYSSDAVHGFQVAASNLPVAPAVPAPPALIAPEPVQDTPEVVEARAKHLVALKEAEARAAEIPAAVVTKSETILPSTLGVVSAYIPSANLVGVSAPIVSYTYGIPGASVAYSAFGTPAIASYTTQIATPVFAGLPLGEAPTSSDSVTVEAKSAPVETKEKSD